MSIQEKIEAMLANDDTQRSRVYITGARSGLAYRLAGIPVQALYTPPSVEYDAWLSGFEAGEEEAQRIKAEGK